MARFRCRSLSPEKTEWHDVDAETPESAANDYHINHLGKPRSLIFTRDLETGGRENVCFADVEVEGHGLWVSRFFARGIMRSGGVRPRRTPAEKLADIAVRLGWTGDPKELLEAGWEGEEAWSTPKDAVDNMSESEG